MIATSDALPLHSCAQQYNKHHINSKCIIRRLVIKPRLTSGTYLSVIAAEIQIAILQEELLFEVDKVDGEKGT